MTKTFHEISIGYEHVLDMCYDANVSDEEIDAALAQLGEEFDEKVDTLRITVQQLKATIDRLDTEIIACTQYKEAIESRVRLYRETDLLPF